MYDVIIAGAGLAGILTAARLSESNSDLKILILEKDFVPGGRLRTTGLVEDRWSCGLNGVSQDLFEFTSKTFNAYSDGEDFPNLINEKQSTVGILSGGKISELEISEVFTKKGARRLGGLAAQRDWDKVETLFEEGEEDDSLMDQQFSKSWKYIRKNPAAIVMQHYATCFGVTDIWSSNIRTLKERSKEIQGGLYSGAWEKAIENLLAKNEIKESIELKTECFIIDAKLNENEWTISTDKGEFKSKKLVVAQAPWQALEWLPKEYWKPHVLEIAMKTRPVSVVVLASVIKNYVPIPDIVIVPSEHVNMTNFRQKEICFKTVIDYEVSLDAPEVVKAVKRLKRAKKKLVKYVEGLELEKDHLELLSVGWAQSTSSSDRRYQVKLDKKDINSDNLFFCGDAYGGSSSGDHNLKNSLLNACDNLGQQFQGADA